jgi:probable F420-dependent oxidoreductase
VVFPPTEIGADPAVIRDYALTIEGAGFDHLLAYDHVLGAHPDRFTGTYSSHSHEEQFHEPLVLFGYLAGITRRLGLMTGILILPQRQTALVAKQAAAIDVLSGGRLRLGVGLGWNFVEYEALGEDFHTRGRRVSEQVELLRKLWTEPLVTFEGKYHHIDRAGINPLPMQQPIPIWMGAAVAPEERTLKRLGRLADGWLPQGDPTDELRERLQRLRGYMHAAGRDPASFGIEGQVSVARTPPEAWVPLAERWRAAGATHLAVTTMRAGFTSTQQHLETVLRWKEAVERG